MKVVLRFFCLCVNLLLVWKVAVASPGDQENRLIQHPGHESGLHTEDDVQLILSKFNLNGKTFKLLSSVNQGDRAVPSGQKGQSASTWFLESIYGDRLVLKEVPWYAADEESHVLANVSIMTGLREGFQLSIPKLVQTREGLHYFKKAEKRYFILQEFLSGRYPTLSSEDELRNIGRTLAQLHLAGSKFLQERAVSLQQLTAHTFAECFLNIFEKEFLEKNPNSPQKVLDGIRSFIAKSKEFLSSQESVQSLGMQTLAHGDFNPANVLVSEKGEVSAILDYDNLHRGNSLEDLARTLLFFAFFEFQVPTTRFKQIPDRFSVEIAKPLLEGYLKESHLSGSVAESYLLIEKSMRRAAVATTIELLTLGFLNSAFPASKLIEAEALLVGCIQVLMNGLDELKIKLQE